MISVVDGSFGTASSTDQLTTTMQATVDSAIAKLKNGLGDKYKVDGQVLKGYPKSEIVKCAEY